MFAQQAQQDIKDQPKSAVGDHVGSDIIDVHRSQILQGFLPVWNFPWLLSAAL